MEFESLRDKSTRITYWARLDVDHKELEHLTYNQEMNLRRLRDGLRLLQSRFGMKIWRTNNPDNPLIPDRGIRSEPVCGSTACAGGWGPVFGIHTDYKSAKWQYFDYSGYVCDAFGAAHTVEEILHNTDLDSDHPKVVEATNLYTWVFDTLWADVDNTAEGAAIRIDIATHLGLPPYDGRLQRLPDNPHYPARHSVAHSKATVTEPVYALSKPNLPEGTNQIWKEFFISGTTLKNVMDGHTYRPAGSGRVGPH